MKRKLIAAAMAAAFFAAPAWAERDAGMMGKGTMGSGNMMGAAAMGQGMMGGYAAIGLSEDQRAKIADIRRELSAKQRDLMVKVHGQQQFNMHDLLAPGSVDEAAARKAYDEMSSVRKELFEARLQAAKRIGAVLTDEQRKQLSSSSPCMGTEKQS